MTPSPTVPPELSANILALLSELSPDGDGDALSALTPFFEADVLSDLASRADSPLPGQDSATSAVTSPLLISLTDDQRTLLGAEACDLLDEYDDAMRERNDREDEIRDAYDMIPDTQQSGRGPESAQVCSEILMSGVDQAFARVCTAIQGVTPLIRIQPIQRAGFEGDEAFLAASEAEKFMEAYMLDGPPDLRHLLPVALLRTCKVGTSVFYLDWTDETRRVRTYVNDSRDPVEVTRKEGRLNAYLLDNRDVKLWPPTLINWQSATFVGHEARYTPESWRALAKRYGLPPDLRSLIEQNPGEVEDATQAELRRSGIEPSTLLENKALQPIVLTQLYCNMTLPGEDEPTRFQMILHRPTRTLVYIGKNPYFSGKFPYFPLRYKWSDSSGWGSGVGHEGLANQAADSAMWAIELDSLFASCYWVVLRKAGNVYHTQSEDIHPGAEITVENVEEDFKPVKMGGEAPELHTSRANNYMRFRTSTGLSAMTSGQADPVLKSGASTGGILALIEQGDKKLKMVDTNLRTDLSPLYLFAMECVAQYAPDGLFYQWTDERAADSLRLLKYVPQRGEMAQMFRFTAQAPSVSSSDEMRKTNIMAIGALAQQHVQYIDAVVTEQLTQDNPAAIPRWKEEVVRYLTEIHRETIQLHEIPHLPDLIPEMPETTPQDQIINQMQQYIGQLQQQLEQLAAQGAGMMGGGGAPAEAGGEMPPKGMPSQQMPMNGGGGMGMMPAGGMEPM